MDVSYTPEIKELAKNSNIKITSHKIIYSVLDEIKDMLVSNSP